MALYETYLDARFRGRQDVDSFAESDPEFGTLEAYEREDERDDAYDRDPDAELGWYPGWNPGAVE